MRTRQVCLLLLPLSLPLSACGPAPEPPTTETEPSETEPTAASLQAGANSYVDVQDSFTNEEDQNRWFDLKRGLRADFDDICGDTFCEGDFTNLEALSFRCSVSTRTGQLKTCLWLFAGSYETVTASTGNIRPTARFFHCKIPVQGTAVDLLDALLGTPGRGPLWRALPGDTRAIYDVLADCL